MMNQMVDKKIIFIDMDETIFPLLQSLLPKYNQVYNDNLTLEDFTDYDVTKFIHSKCLDIWKEFCNDDVFENAKPIGDSVNIITQLNEQHEIYFATAGFPQTVSSRHKWLKKYFPFYNSNQLIICRKKQLLHGDLLIDDFTDNLIGGFYKPLIYMQPWNKNFIKRGFKRMNAWDGNSIDIINEVLNIKPCGKSCVDLDCVHNNCMNCYDDDSGGLYCKLK